MNITAEVKLLSVIPNRQTHRHTDGYEYSIVAADKPQL